MTSLKIIAPAKTNLYLGVGPVRQDGFHEVTTVMHTLELHDLIHFDYQPGGTDGLVVDASCYAGKDVEPLEIASKDNLAVRAVYRLAEHLGRDVNETIHMRIDKNIPHKAGLGGGSSNAAAALVAAAQIWGLDTQSPYVLQAASELGSDISFFLYGGCALFSGKGDVFERSLRPMNQELVIIKPFEGVSTAAAYQVFDKNPCIPSDDVLEQLKLDQIAQDVPLFNGLEEAATTILPELRDVFHWASMQNEAQSVFISGSGSSTIVFCTDVMTACGIAGAAKKKGWWACATNCSSLGAAVLSE